MKVNASFKRFLCLLLVLLMFPLDALAVVVPGGGTNIGYAGGKTTKFRFREYVGIALGIQQMQGDEYRVGKPTEDEIKSGKQGTSGMARVVQHFLYSYPNPYAPSGGQGLFYIVPSGAGAPKYVAAVSSAGVGQTPIGSNWCYASSGAFSHTKSDELFKALTSKISDQNPNPSIDPNYFIQRIVDLINESRSAVDQFETFSGHCFRHTYATRAFEADVDPKVVQKQLGHATLKMTMDLYTHLFEDKKLEELTKLDAHSEDVFTSSDSLKEQRYRETLNPKVVPISEVV